MLSTSLPSLPRQKYTFADIAAMGTSSECKLSETLSTSIRPAQKETNAQNEKDGKVVKAPKLPMKDSSEDSLELPKVPTVVKKKESPWKILDTSVPIVEKSSEGLPTPAESSQTIETVKKFSSSSSRPKTGSWKKVDIDVSFKGPNRRKSSEKNTFQQEMKGKEDSKPHHTGNKTKSAKEANNGKESPKQHSQHVETKRKSKKSPTENSKSKRNEIGKPPRRTNSTKSSPQNSTTKRQKQRKSNNRTAGNQIKNTTGRSAKSNKPQKRKGNNNRKSTQTKKHPSKDFTSLRSSAVAQVEYFFSVNELVKNVFLRKQMDVEGFLPAMIIFNFPSVLSFGVPYHDLLQSIASTSKIIEVDMENDCLRLKGGEENYKKWLFPNEDGTFGCPKWIKQQESSESKQTENLDEDDVKEDMKVIVEMGQSEESRLNGKEKQHDKTSLPDLAMTDSDTDQTSTDSDSQ